MGTMKGMLRRENVQIVESCGDWENAVRVAVQPLVDTGYVTPAYADGIIETACTFGPYFVLAPAWRCCTPAPSRASSGSSWP